MKIQCDAANARVRIHMDAFTHRQKLGLQAAHPHIASANADDLHCVSASSTPTRPSLLGPPCAFTCIRSPIWIPDRRPCTSGLESHRSAPRRTNLNRAQGCLLVACLGAQSARADRDHAHETRDGLGCGAREPEDILRMIRCVYASSEQ